ncbi:MAG: molybdenum cofactor biosynthesis protein MoaE [Gemmatimonadaceae bacterium]
MRVRLVNETIETFRLLDEVASYSRGATAIFVGTVRNQNNGRTVTAIEYSAYDAMAESEMLAIISEAGERFDRPDIVVEHRLGLLQVGDASIVIAAAHERRAQAIGAMQYVIEEFKLRVPIWKMEHYEDGSRVWIDPTRERAA